MMKISTAVFRQEALGDQSRRGGSKQHGPEFDEGKAAAIIVRGAYWFYVSTEKG